jgi:1D-myo-inositol 3-kinase
MVACPDFLAIGHVTRDLLPDRGSTVGGTVTYACLTARALGLSVGVVTSAPTDLDVASALRGIHLHVVPASQATTFENIYIGSARRQRVHGIASTLHPVHLPSGWQTAPLVLLAPVARELGTDWLGVFRCALIGVTPQGWMRQWDSSGQVMARPWEEAPEILPAVDVLCFSEDDVGRDEQLIHKYAGAARIAVVTRGRRGATVFHDGTSRDFPAFRARELDPTGAGDVFAAAFLVRLQETGDTQLAATFANCAASFAIEGPGTTTIPSRQQVEERLLRNEHYE